MSLSKEQIERIKSLGLGWRDDFDEFFDEFNDKKLKPQGKSLILRVGQNPESFLDDFIVCFYIKLYHRAADGRMFANYDPTICDVNDYIAYFVGPWFWDWWRQETKAVSKVGKTRLKQLDLESLPERFSDTAQESPALDPADFAMRFVRWCDGLVSEDDPGYLRYAVLQLLPLLDLHVDYVRRHLEPLLESTCSVSQLSRDAMLEKLRQQHRGRGIELDRELENIRRERNNSRPFTKKWKRVHERWKKALAEQLFSPLSAVCIAKLLGISKDYAYKLKERFRDRFHHFYDQYSELQERDEQ